MTTVLLHLFRLLPFLVGGHRQLALENLAIRQQLAVYKRTAPRLPARGSARSTACSGPAWPGSGSAGGRRWSSSRPTPSCAGTAAASPSTGPTFRAGHEAAAHPSAPRSPPSSGKWPRRIPCGVLPASTLLKLGIVIAERTVSRLMPKRRPEPSQTWRTFLANHVRDLVSIDFFTVPTVHLASCLSSSCSPITAGTSSTSTSPSTPPLPGPPNRSWTHSRTSPRQAISCVIVIESMFSHFGAA
jgi:hypothetical protein